MQQRIFEPFFTTKERGKGTGLGLATVFGIVKQSGGSIWVDSEPGQGAAFKIYFPRIAARPAPAPATSAAPAVRKGTETILLVEDEAAVRGLVHAVLLQAGYHVLVAAEARSAIDIADARTEPIDLLLTDVMMPGLAGSDLFVRLRKTRPSLRVLFMSGFADEVVMRQGVLDSGTPFLQKPFTAIALAQKVRGVLDAHEETTG